MVGKRTRTVVLVVILLMIVISAFVLFIRYPSKFEIIYGGIGAMMAAIALYLSMHSLDVAESAQKDSSRSADAAKDSVKIAEDALGIAKSEADANVIRYRIEKGSFLTLKKKNFFIAILAPYSSEARYDTTETLDAIHNPTVILLENKGMGTAANISYSFHLLNVEDYDDLTFESDHVILHSSIHGRYYGPYPGRFPKYTFEARLFSDLRRRLGLQLTFTEGRGNISEEASPGRKNFSSRLGESYEPIQIGYLDHKEKYWFYLPGIFNALSHQYFLEQRLVREEFHKTPIPRLLLRVYYSEEISEHMNQFEEARRVKEFLITPSNNTKLVPPPEDNPHDFKGLMLSCSYVIKPLGDVPLPSDESEQTEVSTNGSTGTTGT